LYALPARAMPKSPPDDTYARLAVPVHLQLGRTTLQQVAAELTRQTGIKVEVAPCLQARILIVQMDHLSAAAVLDTLAELNDREWYRADTHAVLLTRHAANPSQTLPGLATAMQTILPKDYRRYFGDGLTLDDVAPTRAHGHFDTIRQWPHWDEKARKMLNEQALEERLRDRMLALANKQSEQLFASLQPDILDGRKVYPAQLTPQQQALLQTILMLDALHPLFSGPMVHWMRGHLVGYERDLANVQISLNDGNGLKIDSSASDGNFGVAIPGLPSTHHAPKPLDLLPPVSTSP
jgi:hypothetical protein